MEDQGEAVRAYGTCPLCKALHHPGGRGGRERERERDHQYCSANTYMSYGKLHVFLTNLPYLEVIQGMESIVRVLSLIHP